MFQLSTRLPLLTLPFTQCLIEKVPDLAVLNWKGIEDDWKGLDIYTFR